MIEVFGRKIEIKYVLLCVILFGAILRFWGLGSAEFFHDEGFYAFRSIGYLDYIQNDYQTTPIQWFKDLPSLPWWTHFSFHDHPPLFFLIQNIFFKVLGDSLFIARLPSALAGIASIYLAYLLGKKSFQDYKSPTSSGSRTFMGEYAGLFAAFLLSINLIHIWISRSSLMESVQILFILWNIYLFFQFLEDQRRWKLFAVTLGLSFLTKYTSIFLLPAYGTYLLIFYRNFYKKRELYFALGLAALIFSPVLIYNFYLYKSVGHFDLQFAYLFKQATPEWQFSLGKTQDPFSNIISNLLLLYSIPFLLAGILGIIYSIFICAKNFQARIWDRRNQMILFWLFNFIFITLMLIKVGSAFRFIVLYAVPAIMLIAVLFDYLRTRFNQEIISKVLIAIFLIYESYFASNIFFTFPDFGIAQLDKYLNSELGDQRSLAIPASPNPHLNQIIKDNALWFTPMGKSILIIYDENIGLSPRLWLITRRNYYHGIPALTVNQFKNLIKDDSNSRFHGYNIYFVKASDKTYLNPLYFNPAAQEFEAFLRQQLSLSPDKMIYGYNNLLMFTAYKFSL